MTNRAHPEVSEAPTRARLRGAKNSPSRAGVSSSRTRSPARRWGGHLRFPGQAQGALADDAALDLARARVDGPRAAGQEDVLPAAGRVAGAIRSQQAVRALDRHRDLAEPLVVLAPEQLGHRRLRARRPALRDL